MNRKIFTRRASAAAALMFICSVLVPASVHSQPRALAFERSMGSVPVTIVLAEGQGPPVIFRRATEPRNVIFINRSISGSQLSSAVFALLIAEARDPSGRERSDSSASQVNMPPTAPGYANAGEAISRILHGPVRRLNSFGGDTRTLEVWVSPLRGNSR
jgi:hypothetical protein